MTDFNLHASSIKVFCAEKSIFREPERNVHLVREHRKRRKMLFAGQKTKIEIAQIERAACAALPVFLISFEIRS